ncbi:excalibur calcium-binding domain-containing protein [Marininema halotolerans]|nr:excalibur calcium-binding domain-containing protein [Marininema halotolerans]
MQITSPNDRRDEDKDCSDFTNQKEAKKYLLPGDPHRLDPDRDGKPCESLPLR